MQIVTLVGGAAAAIGGILVSVSVALVLRRRAFERIAAPATGTVVGHERRVFGEDRRDLDSELHVGGATVLYFPIIEFQASGGSHRFSASVGAARPDPPIGTRLEVSYDPDHPSRADRNDPRSRNLAALILGGIGAFCLLVGAALLAIGK